MKKTAPQKYPILPNSAFMTFSEVQSYLGVKSRKTILKYIKRGELPAFKLGGTRWRIKRGDVDHFLSNSVPTLSGGTS